MENHNEDFFARTDIAALRAMRRQYPGVRRLLRRDDTLKDADLLTVYGVLLADKEFVDASTIWALSRSCRSLGPAMAWVAAMAIKLIEYLGGEEDALQDTVPTPD